MSPPFTLYTASTPNGYQASLIFEELKAAYPDKASDLDYEVKVLSFQKEEQKESWFVDSINPNGRIPAIVHHRGADKGGDFSVFETAAISLYLVQHFDTEYKLSFKPGSDEESQALQWIFFAHGGVAPMQGQANHFYRYAPEKIQYGINRYVGEVDRLYSVLDTRLKGRDFLVGPGRGNLSVADIKTWPWVRSWKWCGLESIDKYPDLAAWIDRIAERPAAKEALQNPPSQVHKSKEEEDKYAKETSDWVMKSNKRN